MYHYSDELFASKSLRPKCIVSRLTPILSTSKANASSPTRDALTSYDDSISVAPIQAMSPCAKFSPSSIRAKSKKKRGKGPQGLVSYLFICLLNFFLYLCQEARKKQRAIKAQINKFNLCLTRLLETKVAFDKMGIVETAINPTSLRYLSNVTLDVKCDILIGWDPLVYNIACLDSSYQWVTYEVQYLQDGCVFVVTYMYGLNTLADRKDL